MSRFSGFFAHRMMLLVRNDGLIRFLIIAKNDGFFIKGWYAIPEYVQRTLQNPCEQIDVIMRMTWETAFLDRLYLAKMFRNIKLIGSGDFWSDT